MPKGVSHPSDCNHCAAIRGALNPNFGGKVQTLETRQKMSDAWTPTRKQRSSERQSGDGNVMRKAEVAAKVSKKLKGRVISAETRAAISRASKGKPKSEAHKQAIAEALSRSTFNQPTAGTWPEQAMSALLEHADIAFEAQKRIGWKVVDFYLPASRAVVEVDGAHWHPGGPDAERDAHLLDRGVSFITHVTDQSLKLWR